MDRWSLWMMLPSQRFTCLTSLSPSPWAASTTTQTRRSQSYQISQRTSVCNKQKLTIPTRISNRSRLRIAKQRQRNRQEAAVRDRTVRLSSSHTCRGSKSSWRKTWYPPKTTLVVKYRQAALLCATRCTEVPKDPHSLRIWATPLQWTHQWKILHRSIGSLNLNNIIGIWVSHQAQLPFQTALWSKNLYSAKRSSL